MSEMVELNKEYSLYDQDSFNSLIKKIHDFLQNNHVVLLEGPIGAGKTHIVKSYIQQQIKNLKIFSSPSFSALKQYDQFYHIDLFKIITLSAEEREQKLCELNFWPIVFEKNNICFIEWPGYTKDLIMCPVLIISLRVEQGEKKRMVFFKIDIKS